MAVYQYRWWFKKGGGIKGNIGGVSWVRNSLYRSINKCDVLNKQTN